MFNAYDFKGLDNYFFSFSLLDGIDNLGLTAEEMFRNVVTVNQYLISSAETRRILLIIDAKDVSFHDLIKFGPFFGLKLPTLLNVLQFRFFALHYFLKLILVF